MRRITFNGSFLFSFSQVLSSLSNLLIGIGLSRNLSLSDFGVVALVLTFIYFAVSLQRSAIGDPLLIFSVAHRGTPRAAVRITLLAASSVSATLGLITLFFPTAYPYYVPFLGGMIVAQDGLRYGLVAIGKRGALLIGDTMWAANSALIPIMVGLGSVTLNVAFSIWIFVAVGTFLFLWLQFRSAAPAGVSIGAFRQITSKVSSWSALQFILANGSVQTATTLFALAVGASNFAGYRAIQMVLSPLIVGTLALSSPLLSFIVARSKGGWSMAQAFKLSGLLALCMAVLGAVAVWQGKLLIALLPGVQYAEFSNLLLPGVIALVFVAANVPLASSLLSRMNGRAFFWASVGAILPTSALVVWAAYSGGTEIAAWAMAAQYAAVTASCALTLGLMSMRERSVNETSKAVPIEAP